MLAHLNDDNYVCAAGVHECLAWAAGYIEGKAWRDPLP